MGLIDDFFILGLFLNIEPLGGGLIAIIN